ncbi:MAG: InlB B-repeat-containing protein [Ruminococcus sp.]
MPSHTITLYAKWKAPTYTVTFNPNGGTVTESTLTVTKGHTLGDTLPTPIKEGDEFLGWYTDGSFTHKFVKESQIVKDQTLYAKWKSSDIITYYIVAKNVDGKELWRSEAQSIEKGKNASVNAQPIDDYYPQELSKSVIINNDKQEIVFIYKPLENWTYTIRYVDESGKEIGTAESVTTTDNMKTVVYKVFEGYQLTSPAVVQAIKGQTTEIVFTYAAPEATYTVEHWLQNPDGTYYKKEFELQGAEKIGAWVSATPKGYTGFTCVSGEIERSGAVVKGGGLVLKVYYNRESLSVKDYTGKYDGQEHTITITAPGIEGDVIQYQIGDGQWTDLNDNFTNLPKYKDCGTTVIKVRVVNNGNVGPAVEAKISITQRKITLTSAKDEKFYDGTPLTNDTIVVGGEDEFVEGEGIASYGVTGSQTEAGESDNVFDYTLKENTKSENYEIQKKYGKLKVKPVDTEVVVTITEHSGTGIYDGNKQTVTGYDVTNISNTLYSEKDFSFNGNAVIEGTNAGSYNMELKAADFENISKNFTNVKFVIVDGTLEIARRPVTIKAKESSKVYGNSDPAFDLATLENSVGDELKDLDLAVIRSDAGDDTIKVHENVLSIQNSKEALEKEYTNYTFTIIPADFTIFENENGLTVSAADVVKEYDGNSYGVTATARIKNAEIENPNITIKYWNEKTNAYDLDESPEYRDVADTPATVKFEASLYGYKSVQGEATVTINKRSVLLTSASASKIYDGTPLIRPDVTIGGDGFVNGEVSDVKAIGSALNVSDKDVRNEITFTQKTGYKAENYDIKYEPGTLRITPIVDEVTITITEHSASLKYNGAEQSVTGYDTAIDNTLYKETDFTFSGDATAKGTDFGSYPMNLKAEDFTNKNKNFANVVFEIVDGQLEITKRDVELISGSDEKVYDGTPLTKNHILIAGDQFVPGEGADYDVTGSQTNAGSSDNEFTYRLNSSTKAINYNIKTTPGTLKVTPVTDNVIVTITEHSGSAKYDGTEKTVTGYDVAIDNELYTENDFTFSGNDVIKATDADIYNMELKPSDFNNISHNFASVTFKIVDGTLNISRRDVTLTSATDSKTYDGKPLTNDNVAVGGDGFAEGEGAVYNVTGSQTEAGFSNNTFSYELKDNTKPDNYNITSFEGILTVSSNEDEVVVTITGNKGTQKYDGTEKTVEGYTVSITSPLYKESDFTFDGIALAKGTNADTYMMGLSEENFTNTNKNFARVTFHVIDGSLVIEKRNLVLTSASAQKVYNGTELTAKDVTVSGDGFVKGEGASYDVTGTQTTVGDSENTFTYKLNENTNADNYTIETKNGSLLVTPVTDQVVVTLKENSGTEVYDGTEKTVTGYTVADISNKLYTDKDFTFTGNAEVKGTDAGTYDMELKAEDFQNINPNFTNVVFKVEDGALEITRRQVTFQADSGEKKYDGEELTVPTWKLADGTLADGQQEIAHVEGSQTLVGESENKITDLKIFANAASQEAEGSETEAQDVTKNYSIILLAGLLKVTDGSEEDPVDPGQVVTKTHEDKTYDLDETVTFTINVKNIYDEAKTVRIIELPGVVIEGAPQETPNVLTVEKVPAGETVTATATYKITEADIANGSFVNTVKVEFEGGKPFENTDTVITVDPVRSYTLTKKSSASIHENGMFKAGETIHYTLTVTNTGNQTLENVEITDTLNAAGTISNIQGADSKQDGKVTIFTISSLAPKAEATITYDYVVQEADKGNTISNAAVGTPANPEDPDGEKPGDNTDNPVENPKLEVKKDIVSITAADGTQKDKAGKADLNDIITYSVTVTNTGNMKLTNVKITDSLEGIQLAEGQSFDLGILEAGEAKTVTYTYQVKESDLGKSILNTATATGDVPENPADTPKPEGKDEKEVPTEDPANCSITVTKRLTNIQGELLAVRAADFYVTLFSDEAMTQKAADTKMIHFDENQGTSSVTFDQLKRGTYYVAETDAEGKVVAEGTYNNGSYVAQYQAGNKVEITENGTAAQFQFDNQFLLLPDEYYIVKTITINKTVVKKNGEDLKSEETFYAGIFKDEDCTQLADGVSQNIVPLVMDGESTATAKTEVTVPVGGEEIKLYVTEVTADGTPVALNDTFEYDVEINDGFVTLSETSEDATVLIINTSRKEEPEPTAEPAQEPTEAPAEPTQAPQITQQPEDRAVTTNGVKTGDDSPLTQLAFMLFAASAAILLIIFLKKKDEKDIMK